MPNMVLSGSSVANIIEKEVLPLFIFVFLYIFISIAALLTIHHKGYIPLDGFFIFPAGFIRLFFIALLLGWAATFAALFVWITWLVTFIVKFFKWIFTGNFS